MDDRLNPTHVSLYIALFTLWNLNRFENPISINRKEVMTISKIGSKHTYHKCLKELDEFGFFKYRPSHNPLKGSLIDMFIFGTSTEQAVNEFRGNFGTSSEQALHPSLNYNKHIKHKQQKENFKNYEEPL